MSTGRRLAAAGLVQVAAAAVSGWPLAALYADGRVGERLGVRSLPRVKQAHLDWLVMGGLVTAAGAAVDPPPWAATAVVVAGVTNPALFLPLAWRPAWVRHPAYQAASVASFAVATAGWLGVARAALRAAR